MSLDWTEKVYSKKVDRSHQIAIEVVIQKLRDGAVEGVVR